MRADEGIDRVVGRLAPRVEAPFAHDPAGPAARELRSMIIRQSKETTMAGNPLRRRSLLIGIPVAAGLAGAAVVGTALVSPSSPAGPPAAEADVLAISEDGGYLDVTVNDPVADPVEYAHQFEEYGLDVDLSLVPASPTLVGRIVMSDAGGGIEVIEAPGECAATLGGCAIGVRIPLDHPDPVRLVFGRAPAEGEEYRSSGLVTDPGEILEDADLAGMRVSEARDALAERGMRASDYRYQVDFLTSDGTPSGVGASRVVAGDEVPGDWYVHDVVGTSDDSVLLFVGPGTETEQLPCDSPEALDAAEAAGAPATAACESLDTMSSPVPGS
ncbi:hypothetical protein [Actinorugispora endophytica]|uniref:Uncharacterized protein n=1 Tax=Actinorugispora endophytica TaxID=1605990 RepID=A0A4R6V441_9ACTN|nr:hypothetical protein [Actinorugispora endophytica]TDQ53612.1 hypothetical protein EV190_10360 [Actinorugispora endophytica]